MIRKIIGAFPYLASSVRKRAKTGITPIAVVIHSKTSYFEKTFLLSNSETAILMCRKALKNLALQEFDNSKFGILSRIELIKLNHKSLRKPSIIDVRAIPKKHGMTYFRHSHIA